MENKQKKDANLYLKRIQGGTFSYLDVNGLIMTLRESARQHGFKHFNEVAHFIAHNEQRDRGPIKERLDLHFYRMQFYTLYQFKRDDDHHFDPKSLPFCIGRFLKMQLAELSDEDLLPIGIKREEAKSLLRLIKEDKVKKRCHFNVPQKKLLDLIQHLTSFIFAQTYMTQSDFYNEMVALCVKEGLQADPDELKTQIDKFIISIMYLMHDAKFKLDEAEEGVLRLMIVQGPKETKILKVMGKVKVDSDGKPLVVVFDIFSSDVIAEDWTEEKELHDQIDIDSDTFKIKNE